MLLTFANDAQAIGACRFEVIAPTNGQVIYNNQSFPVKVKLIDCPKAYKIDYALVSLTIPSLKQVYEPNMLLGDFNTITLPSYSGDKVAKEFENCGSTHLVVSV
ncbi:MAG: hypothetical protein PHO23_03175 [Candidatus Pacebacteria bacterium]|nr:hypothetical protein [Candidatus Paceibacterota bacterium]